MVKEQEALLPRNSRFRRDEMDILQILNQLIFDYTLRTVALGSAALGIVSGALGSFAVLRKQSLLGDAISHAALPGVVLAFLLTRSKAPLVLVVGAGLAGWLATLWIITIIKRTRIKEDAALGIVLSVFFGLGMMLLTYTQRLPDARQAGLDQFLFGQAAALLERDVITMAVLGAVALLLMSFFWKEFKLLALIAILVTAWVSPWAGWISCSPPCW
jgi:manganese/zinc/iron transport system permease protein